MSRTTLRTAVAVSLAVASALASAQNVSYERRFTPVLGAGDPLYPQTPQSPTRAPQVLEAESGGVDYRANRAVDRVVVEVDRDGVAADGQSPVRVVVQLFDEQGKALAGEAFVTVEHSGGRLRLPGAATDEMGPGRFDADRATSGVQLPARNGRAEFELLAPHEPQDVLLRVTSGAHAAQGVISFVPEMRELLATGLIEGVINFRRHGAGLITGTNSVGDGFERDIRRWERQFNGGKANGAARTAFFVKGTIKGEYLLTAAYDSDKQVRARLLRDIQPDEYYPVYGDASLRGFDARSAERLYVRVDSNRSYLLYGDFQTGSSLTSVSGADAAAPAPQRVLGTYNRTATGLGWHLENSRLKGNVFAIHDSLRQVVEELSASGSGPYGLRNNAVLEGSERVEVVVRDRNQPSRIISVRLLARLVDYSFEPFSGRILLASFLPSFDDSLNPVSLRITYELDQDTERFLVAGTDAQLRLGERAEIGGSYVEDRNPFAAFDMASANLGYRFGENTWFVAEAGRTRSEVNTNSINQYGSPALQSLSGLVEGDAWRLEFGHAGKALDVKIFAGQSDPAFNNPASPLYGGRGEYSLATNYRLTQRVDVYAEALRSEDRNPSGGERDAAGLGTRVKVTDRLLLDVGYRAVRETVGAYYTWANSNNGYGNIGGLSGGYATGAAGGLLGYGQQPLDPLTGLPVIQNGSMGDVASTLPVGTELSADMLRLGAGWRATERLQLGAEIEQDIHGEDRRRLAAGLDYQLRERSRLYGRYEQQTGLSGAYGLTGDGREANTLALGVDAGFLRDTQVFSEYRLRDAIAGRDTQAASGIRTRWDIREGLRMDASLEHTNVITGMVGDSTGAGIALDYSVNPLWRGAMRVEHRISDDVASTAVDEGYNTTLVQFMAARKLSRDWTLLARNYLLRTAYDARGDVLQERFQLGVAYRDTDTNRVNALARYEYKLESDESRLDGTGFGVDTGQDLRSGAHIVSAHADWHPSRPWWLTGRVAAKWQRDTFMYVGGDRARDDFHAVLLSGRVVYDFTENWDVGVLASSFMGQRGANQYALGMEIGRLLRQNLWLSAGYNATGFRGDADLTGYEYTQRGVFLRLRFKFDEDLFRRDEPRYREPLR